jgi:biopolymer transport protein ExbD
MGAQLDTGNDERSVDIQINIVPFIDVMSCLTAFLLVSAAWLNIARIDVAPSGRSRDADPSPDRPVLSVLVASDRIYVGATRIDGDAATRVIDRGARPADAVWAELDDDLRALKHEYFADHGDIQIAAESRDDHVVAYQDLVAVMDHAIRDGFPDIALTDPAGLSWRPRL